MGAQFKPGALSLGRGFTLIEIIITIVILAIIAGILAPVMSAAFNGFESARVRNNLTAQSRVVLERLTREIREADASPARLTITGGGTTLQFRQLRGLVGLVYAGPFVIKTYNACKTVRVGPAGTNLNWLDDITDATTNSVLTSNLGAINFTYTAGNTNRSGVVSVDLTLTDGSESIVIHRDIHIRNTLGAIFVCI